MLKNYLLTAIRNLWRSKAFSFINLTGLAVGMASATLLITAARSNPARSLRPN
jgi:putative ABC transport system permease protein